MKNRLLHCWIVVASIFVTSCITTPTPPIQITQGFEMKRNLSKTEAEHILEFFYRAQYPPFGSTYTNTTSTYSYEKYGSHVTETDTFNGVRPNTYASGGAYAAFESIDENGFVCSVMPCVYDSTSAGGMTWHFERAKTVHVLFADIKQLELFEGDYVILRGNTGSSIGDCKPFKDGYFSIDAFTINDPDQRRNVLSAFLALCPNVK
jgi:hypothetical protein